MAAIHRKTLLGLLQDSAEAAGVDVRYSTEAPPMAALRRRPTTSSWGRTAPTRPCAATWRSATDLGHSVDDSGGQVHLVRHRALFDGLTFVHRTSEHGNFAVHGYPISDELSTFIVETDPRHLATRRVSTSST